MPVLIAVLLLLSLLTWLVIIYIRKTNHFKKYILPEQISLVNDLIKEIDEAKLQLSVCAGSDAERPQSFTLFEIARFIDDDYRFSNELYDEYGIFFADNKNQLIDFNKYITNPLFPKDIREELKIFYNPEFKVQIRPFAPFFKVDIAQEIADVKDSMREFFKGTGEAFENWVTFKESADNLKFMINQWINKSLPD